IIHATRSVISGSLPLAVLTGGSFIPKDLDIYVPASQEETLLELIKMHFQCNTVASLHGENYTDNNAVATIRWLSAGEGGHRINIMTCTAESAILPIFYFHSSLVMNFISSVGLYCAFPELTINKTAIPAAAFFEKDFNKNQMIGCFNKYTLRGFNFNLSANNNRSGSEHACFADSSCPRTLRTLYDGKGLFIPY
ncbi:hypothetical protein B0H10DRAFT_1687997, partial [Mycena sp. CBHHK59/15]